MYALVDSDFNYFCNLLQEKPPLSVENFSSIPPILYYYPLAVGSFPACLGLLPVGATLLLACPWNYLLYKMLFKLPIELGVYLPCEKEIFHCSLLNLGISIASQLNLLRKIKIFTTQYVIIGRADYIQDFYHYFELIYPINNIKWLSGAARGKQVYQEFRKNQ
ncbi:MAG: hypothetical protein RML72_10205 [Bacteroidia bacterium]|nr:hypothetical protein [Bacteroidia bacterium]MDW8159230.1 hypothetical protein [Bacteroidia bacterium]